MGWPPYGLRGMSGHGEENTIGYTMMFAIACYDEYPEAYNTIGGKFFYETLGSRNVRYNNNFHLDQGDFYSIRAQCDWFTFLVLDQLNSRDMYMYDMQNSPYQFIYRLLPNGGRMMDGDGINYPLVKPSPETLMSFLGGVYNNDSYLYGDFYRYYDNIEGGWDNSLLKSTYLIMNDVDAEIKSTSELPLSMYSGNGMGVMTARTSWDEGINSNTMAVSMKMPENYFAGHQKRDAGQFYIYYKGPLALTSGVYTGNRFYREDGTLETNIGSSSEHNLFYAKDTISQNCVIIYNPDEATGDRPNNGGQYPMRGSVSFPYEYEQRVTGFGKVLGYDYGDDLNAPYYTYLKGDLSGWYGAKAKSYERSFMFFNFFDETYPGALIVFDAVTSAKAEFNKYWLLHCQQEPEIKDNITVIRNTQSGYNGRLINETLLPKAEDLNIKKIGGEGMEYPDLFGVNHKAVPQNDFNDESGKWRIEVTPKEQKTTDYFLNVMQVADNEKNPIPLKSELIESGDFVGVKIKDRIALFSKNKERTSETQVFGIDGKANESYLFAVADLKEGIWKITAPDGSVKTAVSYKDGGVVSFSGVCGEYKLEYSEDKLISKNFNMHDNTVSKERKPVCVFNLLFVSEIPVKELNGTAYIGIEKLSEYIDRERIFSDNGNSVTVDLFKNTGKDRKLIFNIDSKTYSIDFYQSSAGVKTYNSEYAAIRDSDNMVYIPIDMLTQESILASTARYDEIGKVARIRTTFNRNLSAGKIADVNDGRLKITDVIASAAEEGVFAESTLDNDITTNYYVYGTDNFIQYTLSEAQTISNIGIIWGNRASRQAKFEIFVSEDGESFTSVWKGQSNIFPEKTNEDKLKFEEFMFKPVKAKYVKLGLYGSTTKDISSIFELRILK